MLHSFTKQRHIALVKLSIVNCLFLVLLGQGNHHICTCRNFRMAKFPKSRLQFRKQYFQKWSQGLASCHCCSVISKLYFRKHHSFQKFCHLKISTSTKFWHGKILKAWECLQVHGIRHWLSIKNFKYLKSQNFVLYTVYRQVVIVYDS